MKRKTTFLKSLLVAVGLCVGATSAWAGDKTVVKYSFDDANSPVLTAGSRSHLDYTYTSVISKTPFLNIWADNNSTGTTNISLGDTDLSAETWTLQFDYAGYSGCNSKAGHTYLKAGDTNLFDIADAANWGATFTLNYGTSTANINVYPCNKSTRISASTGGALNTTDYWYHFTIVGSSDGVKLTIVPSAGGTAVVTDAVLSETNVNPTTIAINPGSCGSVAIDELSLSYYVEGEVVQKPIATYTKVDGISRTITATCDTEGAAIYNSTNNENWTEGAEVVVSESGKLYFKAVKGTSESDVVEFDAVAGEAITLNAPTINRTSNTEVTISADQTKLLLSPNATIYYSYGAENGSFTGSKTLTVAADDVITAYAEAEGYTTSTTAERAVALWPTNLETTENTAAKTSGWSANAFSDDTYTASERTYAALLLDEVQWGTNIYLQTDGAWGVRTSGNWYINSNTQDSWFLMKNMKKGDIIVADITYPASATVNATYSKYSYGNRHAYEVSEDGDVELGFRKIDASTMDYIYGVYAYTTPTSVTATLTNINPKENVATFSSKYALDFTSTTTKAYVAKSIAADAVTLEQVTGTVAANTGLYILNTEAASEEIPVVAEGTAYEDNLLVAVSADTQVEEGYVLSIQNLEPVFAPIGTDKPTVKAGHAYLKAAAAGSKALTIDFGTATGISSVKSENKTNGQFFNLAGQRVAQPTKGLYIVNGNKVIIK